MPMRSIILVIVAIVLAGATALLARSLLSSNGTDQQTAIEKPAESTKVLVAATQLGIGKIIAREDFQWQSWPDERLHDSYLVNGLVNAEEFVGHVVRTAVRAGEPITRAQLVAPGAQGFLAAALTPGMRAVTVPINNISGVAGFIFPGDRVDLIMNHEITDSEGNNRTASETVMENLRILAIDTRTNNAPSEDGTAPSPQVGSTATLEVTPKIAEKITVVTSIGSLTLSLRSLAGDSEDGTLASFAPNDAVKSHTWDADVSHLLPTVDPNKDKNMVHLSRGEEISVLAFPKESGQ
ncbi:hypothetical protein JCM17845_05450 [Iodidimonas gelatinilytica]|uniref:SAF domain-containing protein n=1 Tax=Iodidimonas gelatinilytica TaxID=1236966 RepID=A0A5A7MVH8_9PROT|nr:Flp pilus assembly protein CpaB [Iodidimonas gelatinilytica]GEQ99921.1 hypothetical protein JCM17845_05450 [Iodidimonas gelatinilytica]